MKKIIFTLVAAWSLMIGSVLVANARFNADELSVRFRENTLIVASTQMTEARIYNIHNGKMLHKGVGTWCEFELEPGSYRLYAKVNGETVSRKVILH